VFTHYNAPSTIAFKKLAANLIGEHYEPDVDTKDGFWKYVLQRTGLKK